MDRRTKALVAVGVLLSSVALALLTGFGAVGVLYAGQPVLGSPEVASVNATHERVSWETDRRAEGYLAKYVDVRDGGSLAVERHAGGNGSKRHAVVTDLHATANLTFGNRTIEAAAVEKYEVRVVAERAGEVELAPVYVTGASDLTYPADGGLQAPEPDADQPRASRSGRDGAAESSRPTASTRP